MPHLDIPQFLGLIALLLAAAKVLGALARLIGQPAVLGELVAGVLVGASVFGLVNLIVDISYAVIDPRVRTR